MPPKRGKGKKGSAPKKVKAIPFLPEPDFKVVHSPRPLAETRCRCAEKSMGRAVVCRCHLERSAEEAVNFFRDAQPVFAGTNVAVQSKSGIYSKGSFSKTKSGVTRISRLRCKQLLVQYLQLYKRMSGGKGDVSDLPEVCTRLSALHFAMHEFKQSKQLALETIKLDPANSCGYFRAGMAMLHLGAAEEAGKVLFRGLEVSPDSVELRAAFNLALDCARRQTS